MAFDELADVVELSSPASVQRAFASYLDDYAPPNNLREPLLEEKFYLASENDEKKSLCYTVSIPGMDEKVDVESIRNYFEEFLDKIGAENNSENSSMVEVDANEDERGGTNIDIYIAIGGKQIKGDELAIPRGQGKGAEQ